MDDADKLKEEMKMSEFLKDFVERSKAADIENDKMKIRRKRTDSADMRQNPYTMPKLTPFT